MQGNERLRRDIPLFWHKKRSAYRYTPLKNDFVKIAGFENLQKYCRSSGENLLIFENMGKSLVKKGKNAYNQGVYLYKGCICIKRS